jgi:hypothetical protein
VDIPLIGFQLLHQLLVVLLIDLGPARIKKAAHYLIEMPIVRRR